MSTSPNDRDETPMPPKSTVILMALTIADTTWRLFIPSIGLTVLGLMADKYWHTTPWIMIIGIILGSTLALWLVRLQLKKVESS